MTACSNHPGTPSGLALAELLGEAESLVDALREAEQRWCEAANISRRHWIELHAIQKRRSGEVVPAASPTLVSRNLVEACPGGYRLSDSGQQLLWRLDRQRFDWVDARAAGHNARELREQVQALRRFAAILKA